VPVGAQIIETADSTRTCGGQMISEVRIVTRAPFSGRKGKWWEIPVRVANRLHSTTGPEVVRRFLLLQEGDPCLERRRAESERILRGQPYIADAVVRVLSDSAGGVIVVAETVDEFTPIVVLRTVNESPYLRSAKLGDGNFMGRALRVEAEYGEGDYRTIYGGRVVDYQFMRRPWILDIEAERRDVGIFGYVVDLSHPFFTDEQRIAWRTRAEDKRGLRALLRGDEEPVLFALSRRFADVGGVVRIGQPGRLSLFGLSFSREVDRNYEPPVLDSLVDYDGLLSRFQRRSNARVNALWGVRNIYYRKVNRFDALNATQDVRHGFQLGTLFGRSLGILGATDDDILVAADLYTGLGSETTFLSVQGRAEGRQNYDNADDWDGIIVSLSASAYRRIHPRHTVLFLADYGAGWKQRIPLQLTLGDINGGIRGHRLSRDAGARRAVFRLEDRWYLGGLLGQADVGLSPFFDVGFLRAGDAPFGVTTPLRYGFGIGLLGAAPQGSPSTWRLDLAYAYGGDRDGLWELRLNNFNARRFAYRESGDITRSREQAVPSSVFSTR